MDILDLVKDSPLFDDRLIAVTGPILVAMVLGSWHEMKRLFHPVTYIFKNNLSAGFINLPAKEKINSLQLIISHKELDGDFDVLRKEIELHEYGLFYPVSVLKMLFRYISANNISINDTGFLSFLDCHQIFKHNRCTMPVLSSEKLISYIIIYTLFFVFMIWYILGVSNAISFLIHSDMDFTNIFLLLSLIIAVILALRISYIIGAHFISIFLAIAFVRKMKRYVPLNKPGELNEEL